MLAEIFGYCGGHSVAYLRCEESKVTNELIDGLKSCYKNFVGDIDITVMNVHSYKDTDWYKNCEGDEERLLFYGNGKTGLHTFPDFAWQSLVRISERTNIPVDQAAQILEKFVDLGIVSVRDDNLFAVIERINR